MPHVVELFVETTSIELMVSIKVATKVVRSCKAKKALRGMLLFNLMQEKAFAQARNCASGRRRVETKVNGNSDDINYAKKVYDDPFVYEKKRRELREIFDVFDKTNDGQVDSGEVHGLMKSLGLAHDEQQAISIMRALDRDGTNSVTFEELFQWVAMHDEEHSAEKTSNIVDRIFGLIDKDKSGCISVEEFNIVLKGFANDSGDITNEDIRELVKDMDKDGDGQVNLEEFKHMMDELLNSM